MKKLVVLFFLIAADGVYSQQNVAPDGFVRIQGGTFIMGSPAYETGRNDDEEQRQVTINGFYMGKCEVTQKEYQEIMGTNPSNFKGDYLPKGTGTTQRWFFCMLHKPVVSNIKNAYN